MVVNGKYININGIPAGNQVNQVRPKLPQAQESFESVLQGKINRESEIKFSKHAELRLQTRNINLSQAQKDKISEAVKKAEAKGVKDPLILMENMAFVVNVKNRTVITAVNSDELKSNVFTNIDGAVFA